MTYADSNTTHPPALVIGIGNKDRRDDGVGLIIAGHIKSMNLPAVEVDLEAKECSGLIDKWKGADIVILVDAAYSGKEPGTVLRFDARNETIPPGIFTRFSTHAFSVVDTIELAHAIQEIPPHLVVYGIECKTFDRGVGLSPAVENAVEPVIKKILEDIDRFRAKL